MSAVAKLTEAPQAKNPTAAATPVAKEPGSHDSQAQHWLEELQIALGQAAAFEEEESWSGESDRLLRVAHELAGRMAAPTVDLHLDGSIVNRAHTIAFLVKAALHVPGDKPSAGRRAFVEKARVALAALTGDSGVFNDWDTYPHSCGLPALSPAFEVIAMQTEPLRTFLHDARIRAERGSNQQAPGDFLIAQRLAEFVGSVADEAAVSVYYGGPLAWAKGGAA